MKIGNKDTNDRVYIIAEAGVNHGNDLETAKKLIFEAAKAGADAIKFQTYTAEELVCHNTPKFWEHESAAGMDQHEAYQAIGGFPYEWYPELIQYAKDNNIEFLSTPFSLKAADTLNEMGMAAFKVASSDLSHHVYLRHIAKFGKPIFLSTGASMFAEVLDSVRVIQEAGNDQIVVMHCMLSYPTEAKNANLLVLRTFQKAFPNLTIGYSDHTLGLAGPIIAASLGARVIEKHFTLDKGLTNTADHWLSVDPTELAIMAKETQQANLMHGLSARIVYPCEAETRKYDKRSIVSKGYIHKGDTITEEMIDYKRPGTGIWPSHLNLVVGNTAKRNIPPDVPITFEMI